MAHEPTVYAMHQTRVAMPDDRVLTYYDFAPRDTQPFICNSTTKRRNSIAATTASPRITPEVRWNPTLREWVVVAANRMSRPMLPSKDACPLCPGVLELPAALSGRHL
jgi:UDPglucose--hexose-1-phosphate uridylyltransferase